MLYPFELRALPSVFISLPASAAPEAVQRLYCLKGFGQLAHRILNFYVAYLDVALLGRAYITVTQYPLNHQIIDAQFLEIGRKSPPIGLPAVPFQSRLLQSWAEIHLTVCDFLHAIEPYFETLKVNDETEYWDAGDIKLLKQHLANCDRLIEEHLQEHPTAKVKVKEPTGRVVDMITYD
jgi:hypothetical protein